MVKFGAFGALAASAAGMAVETNICNLEYNYCPRDPVSETDREGRGCTDEGREIVLA